MGPGQPTASQPRHPRVDLRLPLLRDGIALPWRWPSATERDELALPDVLRAAAAVADRAGALLLSGGDPLRRGDARELFGELARLRPAHLGICTAGQGLGPKVAERLRALGVQRVQLPFHCARQDAHDWLVGQPGALKIVHRAIRSCIDADLAVSAEIVLTRPTAPHLAETIEVLARLGVRTICVRRLTAPDTEGTQFVPLSPRLALLDSFLERAAAVALERRVRLRLRDLPLCAAPRLKPLFARPDSELWIQPDGGIAARGASGLGCANCPGPPHCAGAPSDYVARFGWEEFVDPIAAAPRVSETVSEQQEERAAAPLTFSWRGPRRVRCEACADADDAGGHYESTRAVRARLVEAARYRPAAVRLVGADLLAHPQAAALLYDALRLFRRVAVAGEASPVVDWSDLDLRRIKDLQRIDVALYGPDAATHDAHCGIPGAFAAMLRGVERLRGKTPITVGAYAILHDAQAVPAFAEAWSQGALPGTPQFRLSARGGSLDELIACAQALPPGAARSALAAVLPRCMGEIETPVEAGSREAPQRVHGGRSMPYVPCGSDPQGSFETCADGVDACIAPECAGTAVGWHRTARSQRWSSN